MNEKELECKLNAVAYEIRAAHPDMYLENVFELLKYGEWKLAVEMLCENLSEYEFHFPKEAQADLVSAAEALGVRKEYWEDLVVK